MPLREQLRRVGSWSAVRRPQTDAVLSDIVQQVFEQAQRGGRWPAVSAGISVGGLQRDGGSGSGEVHAMGLWANGAAIASVPSRRVGVDSPFHLAGSGSAFTATLAFCMQEAGHVRLFDPVVTLWSRKASERHGADGSDDAIHEQVQAVARVLEATMPQATLADLLDHRSGLDDWNDLYFLGDGSVRSALRTLQLAVRHRKDTFSLQQELWEPLRQADRKHEEAALRGDRVDLATKAARLDSLVDVLGQRAADSSLISRRFEERRWCRSLLGYGVAAATLELCGGSGATFEELLREHVFDPLGLLTAGLGEPSPAAVRRCARGDAASPVGHRVRGLLGPTLRYEPVTARAQSDGENCPASAMPHLLRGAGDVHIATSDWLLFLRGHLLHAQNIEAEWAEGAEGATATGDASNDALAARWAQLRVTSPYIPRHAPIGPGLNYRSGFHLTDATAGHHGSGSGSGSGDAGGGDGGDGPTSSSSSSLAARRYERLGGTAKFVDLPFHLSTVGANGAWFSCAVIVPEWDIVACAAANCCAMHMESVLVPAVRQLAYEAREYRAVVTGGLNAKSS